MYTAPIDQTVFQTVIVGLIGWVIYTFLYRPVFCEPEPITFTVEEIREIVKVGVDDFYKSIVVLKDKPDIVSNHVKYTDEMDAVNALITLKHAH